MLELTDQRETYTRPPFLRDLVGGLYISSHIEKLEALWHLHVCGRADLLFLFIGEGDDISMGLFQALCSDLKLGWPIWTLYFYMCFYSIPTRSSTKHYLN